MTDIREILFQRKLERSARDSRSDPYHVALVLEGGGMRGIVSIGMASALEDLGLFTAFDSVHGSSSGACAGAYFTAGQSKLGASIYYEDINNRRFIDLYRALRFRPVMDIDFLIDEVIRKRKPLDIDRILSFKNFLNIIATDAVTGEEVIFNEFTDEDHFLSVLKASICMPIIGGHSVNVGKRRLIDGGMVQQVALDSALRAGATHTLVLMTRRSSELEREERGLASLIEASILNLTYSAAVANVYRRRSESINETISSALSGTFGQKMNVSAVTMSPSSANIGRLTTDRELLMSGFSQGKKTVLDFMNRTSSTVTS